MAKKDVNLWFAKNSSNDIVLINNSSYDENYTCPVCGSKVIPKAIKEDSIISSHFAHVDKTHCNNEAQIHWWTKNGLLSIGDKFSVKVNDDITEYMVSDICVEKSINYSGGIYKPDLSVLTTCGKTIYFEIYHTNKKSMSEYYSIWSELTNVVVEVKTSDIKSILNKEFKALYYNSILYTPKKTKDIKAKEDYAKTHRNQLESINKVNWVIDDINRYNNGEIGISDFCDSYDNLDENERRYISVFMSKNCTNIASDYSRHKIDYLKSVVKNELSAVEYATIKDFTDRDIGSAYFIIAEKLIKLSSFNIKKDKNLIKKAVVSKIKLIVRKHIYEEKINMYKIGILNMLNGLVNCSQSMVDYKYDFNMKKDDTILNVFFYFNKSKILEYSCKIEDYNNIKECAHDTMKKIREKNLFHCSEKLTEDIVALGKENGFEYLNVDVLQGGEDVGFNLVIRVVVEDLSDITVIYNGKNKKEILGKIYCWIILSIFPKKRICCDCGESYFITEKDYKFYKSKKYSLPKRCKSCRDRRRGNV